MSRRYRRGFTVLEVFTAFSIFLLVGTLAVTLFALGRQYYSTGAAQVDVSSSTQQALARLFQEIQESNPAGVRISNSSPQGILLVSARNTAGRFQIYSAGGANNGKPNWTKWICYYLSPQRGSSFYMLVRKEGDPFPSTWSGGNVPTPGNLNNWETLFQNYNVSGEVVARDVKTLDIEDANCGVTGNPLYVQVTAGETQHGQSTTYNSGLSAGSVGFNSPPCAGKTGNWVPVLIRN